MKASLLFLALLMPVMGQIYFPSPPTPDGAAVEANADYPLHVHIIESVWHWDRFGYVTGWGHGDLLGAKPAGFEFTNDCKPPFRKNLADADFYQARWKKPNAEMEILTQQIGGKREDKCMLRVTMRDVPFGHYGRPAYTGAPASSPGTQSH